MGKLRYEKLLLTSYFNNLPRTKGICEFGGKNVCMSNIITKLINHRCLKACSRTLDQALFKSESHFKHEVSELVAELEAEL